mgnify:CR=1 FL=1
MPSTTAHNSLSPSPFQALRPHTATDIVTRPRLLRLLEHGASLTLVVAPAGYGKTTLIADWLETCHLLSAWVTFDAEVTDLPHFLTRLLTALRASLPHFGDDALQDLPAARALPPLAVIVDMLYAAFAALDHDIVLVLDDYHAVAAPDVHSLLAELLRLPPTPLRLVLASRHDPPLPLMSLRAHGQLVEIRSRDLGFTTTEAAQFLTDSLPAPLDENTISDLVRGTEGWAASLRLAQLYLRQEQGFASLAHALEVGARHAREFLSEEVFAGLPPTIQKFLMQTAILERLSARVCAALTEDGDPATAQANLQWLVANGVFTVPIDDAQEWFHCHALLRQFAAQQLHLRYGADAVAALHRRASQWFAAACHTEDAIRHALAAGDTAHAIRILAHARYTLMDDARWMDMAHLLHLFSARQIESTPELLLTQAWFARSQNNNALLQASTQLAADLLNTSDPASDRSVALRGEVESLRSHLHFWRADITGVIDHARTALALLPHTARFARGFSLLNGIVGYQSIANQTAAHALIAEYAGELNPNDYIDQMYLLTNKATLYILEGDLLSLATTADAMLQMSDGRPWTETQAYAHYYRALIHYYRNELADVAPLIINLLTHRYQQAPRIVMQAACVLAMAYQAQGRVADANAVAAAELTYIELNGITEMLPYAHALHADLALRQGNMEAAAAHLREATQAPFPPAMYHYAPHLAVLRLYLQQNTPASLDAADALCTRMEHFWRGAGNAPMRLELCVMRALYWQACRRNALALETLAQAARQAEPGGCIRIFADPGTSLDGLLAQLQQTGVAPLLVIAARAAIAAETPPAARAALPPSTQPATDELAVLLTFREQEVLRLLGEHLTNQEIAAKLCISAETVKRHSISIFRKLDVKNRRAAALYARKLAPV